MKKGRQDRIAETLTISSSCEDSRDKHKRIANINRVNLFPNIKNDI